MSAAGGVTAEELVRSLRRRQAALPSEIGTFVVFEACEAMLSHAPMAATLGSLIVSDEGTVSLPSAERTDQEGAARSLHSLLTSLLVVAGPAPTPALMRLAEEGPLDGRWTLDQMRDDLEAALVPLNRTASRRVLARLVRETGRSDRPSGRAQPRITFNELDQELSSLLGVEHEPTRESPEEIAQARSRATEARYRAPRQHHDDTVREAVENLEQSHDDVSFVDARAARRHDDKTVVDAVNAVHAAHTVDIYPPPQGRPFASQLRGLESISERPERTMRAPRGTSSLGGFALMLLAVGLAAAILVLRPDLLQRLRGEGAAPTAKPSALSTVQTPRGGDLIVRVSNERAQILRLVGHGPVTVKHLPVGVAHEFVAIADGAEPTRVLVPADAEWEQSPEGRRYEVAMQAGSALKPGTPLDLGDTLLPQTVGSARGDLGSVRIVTTPRGAKVYQLIGFAPEARVQDLTLDKSEELLIWKRGHEPVASIIEPSDFLAQPEQGANKLAQREITLKPRPKR